MNAVLERLLTQRTEQESYFDQLMSDVERRGNDMSAAERDNINATRDRITNLDEQIEPLVAFERKRGLSADVQSSIASFYGARSTDAPRGERSGEQSLAPNAALTYGSVGAWMADYVRSRDPRADRADASAAQARLVRAVATQTTADTPGILPVPIVGDVLSTLDAARPFIDSFGAKPLPNGSGASFRRPKITQHTTADVQTVEKTAVASQKLVIGQLNFDRKTIAGAVNISRQDIDWTSPSAWDIVVGDLTDVYGLRAESWAAGIFLPLVVQATGAVATDDLAGWTAALYEAAALVYGDPPTSGIGRLPNKIWCSIDMWGKLGAMVDQARLIFTESAGTSSPDSFTGSMLNLPRIVVPSFPAGTVVVGNSMGFEFYEERIGLLSAVEPSILGVEVAYGGYVAAGMMEASGFAKITPPVVGP
jgi:hypothetical protein